MKFSLAKSRRGVFIANALQIVRSQSRWNVVGRVFLVALLLSSLLAGFSAAANSLVHEWMHHEAEGEAHECVVTLLARGHVFAADAPDDFQSLISFFTIQNTRLEPLSRFRLDALLPPGRAPPFLSA